MTACSSGDSTTDIDTPTTPTTPVVTTANANANRTTRQEYTRLEMPHLHEGTDTVLTHKTSGNIVNYITEWDYKRKTQRWSCYVLDKNYLAQNTTRYYSDTNQYPNDDLIPTSLQWATDPFYSNSLKLDHGHICPSADRLYSTEANIQTFYLTNMQPQFNSFNAGIWATLEKKVRTIASSADTLYVCKGGTVDEGSYGGYNKIYRTLDNGLIVPRYFFMALLRVKNGTYSAIAIWTDQVNNANDTGTNLAQYAISIDELETRTGIDFFCNLPDQTEDTVEKTATPSAWGLY
jgi:endonuclease G